MAMNDASIVQATGWHTRGNLTDHHSPALTDLLREPTRQATFFRCHTRLRLHLFRARRKHHTHHGDSLCEETTIKHHQYIHCLGK